MRHFLVDALLVCGAVAVIVGVTLLSPAGGWIVGGVLAICGGVLAANDGGDPP